MVHLKTNCRQSPAKASRFHKIELVGYTCFFAYFYHQVMPKCRSELQKVFSVATVTECTNIYQLAIKPQLWVEYTEQPATVPFA